MGQSGSQIAGDMAYEATLLGLHGGIRNLTEKGVSSLLDINDEDYGRRAFLSDVGHGMITGALLAPARYIPGGAKVDPFEGFDLQSEINKNFDDMLIDNINLNPSFGDDVVKNLLDPANKAMRDEIRDNSLRVAQNYTS